MTTVHFAIPDDWRAAEVPRDTRVILHAADILPSLCRAVSTLAMPGKEAEKNRKGAAHEKQHLERDDGYGKSDSTSFCKQLIKTCMGPDNDRNQYQRQ